MNGYYAQQYQGQDFQHLNQQDGEAAGAGEEDDSVHGLAQQGMNQPSMFDGENMGGHDSPAKHRRRQSLPVQYGTQGTDADMRRVSMVEFGASTPNQQLNNFHFSPAGTADNMMTARPMFSNANSTSTQQNQPLQLNTQYAGQNPAFNGMVAPGSAYESPMTQHTPHSDRDMASPFMQQNMPMSVDYSTTSMSDMMSDASPMHMFNQNQFQSSVMESPITHPSFSKQESIPHLTDIRQRRDSSGDFVASDSQGSVNDNMRQSQSQDQHQGTPTTSRRQSMSHSSPVAQHVPNLAYMSGRNDNQMQQEPEPMRQDNISWPSQSQNYQNFGPTRPHIQPNYKNAYSSTGFDMLTVLMRVATRKNAEINIGAVDLSCAFVVCDATEHDVPIVYCSENFERLTGYTRHEILGRNCRFLQAPDGKVQPGTKRRYVDDDSVLYLKNMVSARREAQISLINYRKGGQPFMNLLTTIPISYDSDEIKFFVGFQVDLVEQPNSVTNKNPDGSYTINYQRGLTMPRYVFPTNESNSNRLDSGQTVTRDDVSTVLSTIGTEDSELSKRIWDKVLLENTDDVVHVLSLKGLFMYLSPSSKKILEYDANELVGTALSSICHPSDIVPVTRELKDTSSTSSVNVVFRIRRKHSGYMWFEGHGALHTDQGKGRKCIILVGRERPVYTLTKTDIATSGGIGDNELWTKLSTSGMFLFVSSNVRPLLDRQPEELVGTSIQALMRQDSKQDLSRILEVVRTGKRASIKHEMFNKRGQSLQAYSTVYPGDAAEGEKPTFLVAQTRLLKYSRKKSSSSSGQPPVYPKLEREFSASMSAYSAGSRGHAASSASGQGLLIPRPSSSSGLSSSGTTPSRNTTTPSRNTTTPSRNTTTPSRNTTTADTAMTTGGQDGLTLGRQDIALASDENVFDELKTTRSTSWQYELRQMEKSNRLLAEEVQSLLASKKKRKRRKGAGQMEKDCANCHTRVTPEWRRGPSGNRDLCNSCGLRWAKQQGRMSPRTSSQRSVHSAHTDRGSASPGGSQPAHPGTNPEAQLQANLVHEINESSHALKVAKMEAIPAAGYGGGIPSKIEEGMESE